MKIGNIGPIQKEKFTMEKKIYPPIKSTHPINSYFQTTIKPKSITKLPRNNFTS